MTLTLGDLDLQMTLTLVAILMPYISHKQKSFLPNDLAFDPMTLVLKLDPDMVRIYHHTKNEASMSKHSNIQPVQPD